MANFEELKQLLAQKGGGDLEAGMRNLVSPPQPSKWDEIKNYLAMGEKTPLPQEDQAIQDLRTEEPQVIQTPQEVITKPIGINQTQETEPTPEPNAKPYLDKEKEELDYQNSLGYKLFKGFAGAASGLGGRGVGEIATTWGGIDNHRLNKAREENLRSPDSQISQHFRELASMYSDPKEFTVTPAQSAKDIMEAMPWLAKYMGLDIKSDLAEAKIGSGKGNGGAKLRPLEQSTYKTLSDHESAGSIAGNIIQLVDKNPSLVSMERNILESVKSKAGRQDADWQALNTQFSLLRQQLAKTSQGGVLSNQDNALFERIVPGSGATPETVKAVIAELIKNSEIRSKALLDAARKSGRDTSQFDAAPSQGKTDLTSGTVRFSVNGKIGSIPASNVAEFLKKNPTAKKVE